MAAWFVSRWEMESSSGDTVSETVELSRATSSVYVKGVVSDLVDLTS